jgi:hypothetical protein
MRSLKYLATGLVALAAPAVGPSTAFADAPSQACPGQIVATINHGSGAFGASGNPQASAGPGFFLGSDTAGAIATVRDGFCGTTS